MNVEELQERLAELEAKLKSSETEGAEDLAKLERHIANLSIKDGSRTSFLRQILIGAGGAVAAAAIIGIGNLVSSGGLAKALITPDTLRHEISLLRIEDPNFLLTSGPTAEDVKAAFLADDAAKGLLKGDSPTAVEVKAALLKDPQAIEMLVVKPNEPPTAVEVKAALLSDPQAVEMLLVKPNEPPTAVEVKAALLSDPQAIEMLVVKPNDPPTAVEVKAALLSDPQAVEMLLVKPNDPPTAVEVKAALLKDPQAVEMLKGDQAFVPAGAVVAFDDANGCLGTGWTDVGLHDRDRFAGRAIIAVGPHVRRADNGTTLARAFDNQGGVERHPLSIGEMPRHNHTFASSYFGADVSGQANDSYDQATGNTSYTGGGEPHENLAPFIALYLCRKN